MRWSCKGNLFTLHEESVGDGGGELGAIQKFVASIVIILVDRPTDCHGCTYAIDADGAELKLRCCYAKQGRDMRTVHDGQKQHVCQHLVAVLIELMRNIEFYRPGGEATARSRNDNDGAASTIGAHVNL